MTQTFKIGGAQRAFTILIRPGRSFKAIELSKTSQRYTNTVMSLSHKSKTDFSNHSLTSNLMSRDSKYFKGLGHQATGTSELQPSSKEAPVVKSHPATNRPNQALVVNQA